MLFEHYSKLFPLQVDCVKNAVSGGRLAHAYIVNSDDPEIRKEFPVLIAQVALCRNPVADGTPCLKCSVCQKLEEGAYPELHTLAPSSKTRIIPVGDTVNPEEDTLRWFENLFYLTSTGGKKVGIIHDVDRMQQAAQNAFLKTLEEPPGNTLFMLTTGNPSKLLPTTVSRCQLIMLITNKCSYALNHMERLKNILRELQFNSSGNLIKAERCAREIVNISAKIDSEAQKIVGAKWSEQLERAAEELEAPALKRMKNRIDAAERAEYLRQRTYFISAIHTWFAQVFHIASGASADRIANPELFEGIQLPDRISPSGAFKALEHAEKLTYDLNYNIKEELALRVFCLNVAMNS